MNFYRTSWDFIKQIPCSVPNSRSVTISHHIPYNHLHSRPAALGWQTQHKLISGRNNQANFGFLLFFFKSNPHYELNFYSFIFTNSTCGRFQAEETWAWRSKLGNLSLEAFTLHGKSHFSLPLCCPCTCSTIIAPRSLNISLRSEIDCTIWRISRSLSSTISVFCSTNASWSSVKPCWNRRFTC